MDGTVEYPLVNPDQISGEAWAATARQDTTGALKLWQQLRQHFPELPDGYVWAVQLLWQNGRLDEAEALADDAFARFPEHPDVLVQLAWIAMTRQLWDDALSWWARARKRAPDRLDGYLWAARALWQSGRLDDAEAMAQKAARRFPGDAAALAETAWIAVKRQDWPEALRRWRLANAADPARHDAQVGLIQALRTVGEAEEAERQASAALAREPEDLDFLVEHVWAAVGRGDWVAAGTRLEAARGRLQAAGRFDSTLGWVDYRVRSHVATESPGETPAAPAVRGAREDGNGTLSTHDLMLAFESIGERCDFGAVQRHYGVEPLGLLRFAFSRFDALIAALGDRFAAVGSVEDTGFELWQNESILVMRKYGLVFHTFVYQSELPTAEKQEAFRQQQRRRLVFLRNKLLADLDDPQKTYIYATDERASDSDVAELFAALRAYGPNSLLYVRPATAKRPAGTVERLEDGLFAGYYPGLADFLGGEQPPFALWHQLCQETYRLARPGDR
ncbi:MAG TPA: tetratricopeptide repeat protein [Stellaceae bacterium]|nr:tetratricopeptide repeat protein [Stellaceae bacterium]